MGGQLQRLRDGTMDCKGGNPFANEERNHNLAVKLLIWYSLDRRQRRAINLRHEPNGWTESQRTVPESDLVKDEEFDPPVYTTKFGEDIAHEAEMKTPPAEGYRIVRTFQPTYPRNADVAKVLGVTTQELRTLLSNAYAKIEAHELFHLVSE